MRWNTSEILDAVARGLEDAASKHDREQAVYGIDTLDELGLHPLIRQSLSAAGFGVWGEQCYPADRTGRRTKSIGKRCDLVLTPDRRPLLEPDAEATLFSSDEAV